MASVFPLAQCNRFDGNVYWGDPTVEIPVVEVKMRHKVLPLLATLLFAVPAARAAETAAQTLPVPESISAQVVPPIALRNVEDLLPYETLRAGLLADWHPTERRLLIRTRFAESPQIHEVAMPMGARTQLTF